AVRRHASRSGDARKRGVRAGGGGCVCDLLACAKGRTRRSKRHPQSRVVSQTYFLGLASFITLAYSCRFTCSSNFARSAIPSDNRFNRSCCPSVGGASAIEAKSINRASLLSMPVG